MTTLRLTYEELAERVGRSPEGARMLARRRRWRVEKGNDGKARVVVDEAELVVRPPERPTSPDQALEQARLQAEVLRLTERAARAEGEALALRDALADLARRLDRAEERLAMPWWRRLLGR
jgi:hypothetical protein